MLYIYISNVNYIFSIFKKMRNTCYIIPEHHQQHSLNMHSTLLHFERHLFLTKSTRIYADVPCLLHNTLHYVYNTITVRVHDFYLHISTACTHLFKAHVYLQHHQSLSLVFALLKYSANETTRLSLGCWLDGARRVCWVVQRAIAVLQDLEL